MSIFKRTSEGLVRVRKGEIFTPITESVKLKKLSSPKETEQTKTADSTDPEVNPFICPKQTKKDSK